jgi:hypothetical protein
MVMGNDECSGKRGKLEDLREHVAMGTALRERLALSSCDKDGWILEAESELSAIVDTADIWLDNNQAILDGTIERTTSGAACSSKSFRNIVQGGSAIFINHGEWIIENVENISAS